MREVFDLGQKETPVEYEVADNFKQTGVHEINDHLPELGQVATEYDEPDEYKPPLKFHISRRGKTVDTEIEQDDFAKLSGATRLRLAIGQARDFQQTATQHLIHLHRMYNKGRLQPVSEVQVKRELGKLQRSGDIKNGGPKNRLTDQGFRKLLDEMTPVTEKPEPNRDRVILRRSTEKDKLKTLDSHQIRPSIGTSLLELVAEETGIEELVVDPTMTLPETSDWMMPHNSTVPLVPYIAGKLSVNTSPVLRNITKYRTEYGFIETEARIGAGENGVAALTNIRFLQLGIAHVRQAREALREREGLIDEQAVESAEELIGAILSTAAVNDPLTYERLHSRYNNMSLFELTPKAFEVEMAELQRIWRRQQEGL